MIDKEGINRYIFFCNSSRCPEHTILGEMVVLDKNRYVNVIKGGPMIAIF